MRIAFVVHDYNRSWGHSRYVSELVRRYCSLHDVHVFANTFVKDSSALNVTYHHVPACRWNAFTTILSFLVSGTLQALGTFDIVHSQGLCGLRQNVVTAHQCNREWFRARKRVESSLGWKEKVFGVVISNIEKAFYRTLGQSRVIAISNRVGTDLRRNYGFSGTVDVIHHGTDANQFKPSLDEERKSLRLEWGVTDERSVFLFVGDLRKGARQCLLAMKQFPNHKLVIVSRSTDPQYRRLAASLGVEERVIFFGQSDSVERIYGAADVFLLPTPYDPFALVATEAMSCGLAVIVSQEAGASEIVRHGENGLVLKDVGRVEELVSHMKSLSTNLSFARSLGSEARVTTLQMTWDRVAAQTMAVYERQMASRHSVEITGCAPS